MDLATLGLRVDASGVVSGVAQAEHSLDSLGEKGLHIAERLEKTFVTLATTAGLGVLGEHLISESIQAQNAVAQLESAVKAAGAESGITAGELEELAEHLQDVTSYSHQAVEGAQSLLLTFQHITPENLLRATSAVTDLAARMGGDLSGAALQVGKALEDPERGLLALRRAGVVFSATEQGVIKDLFDTGKAAQAQEMILEGLEKRFKGSAAAARDTLGGALHGLAMATVDLFETTRAQSGGVIDVLHNFEAAAKALKPHMGELAEAAKLVGLAFGAQFLAGVYERFVKLGQSIILARAETLAYAENAVIAARATDAEAVATVRALETKRADLVATQAAIVAERELSTARLMAANAAQGESALVARNAAIKELAVLGTQATNVTQELTATETALAAANVRATVTQVALTEAVAATSLASRAAAVGMSLFQGALALVGGLPGLIILGMYGAYKAIKFLTDDGLAGVAARAAEAKKHMDAFADSLHGMSADNLRAQIKATQAALDSLRPTAFAVSLNAPSPEQQAALGKYIGLMEKRRLLEEALTPLEKAEHEATSALIRTRELELGKLTALNAAYGQSELQIKILGVLKDAEIKKAEDAKDHHDAELKKLNELTDAMAHQQIVALRNEAVTKDRDEAIKKITDEASAMRDNYNATLALGRAAHQASELAKVEGAARDYLQNEINAENLRIEANLTLKDDDLRMRLAVIDGIEKEGRNTIDLVEAKKMLNETQAGANALAERNITKTKEQNDATAKAIKAQLDFSDAMAKIAREGFGRILTDGLKSWQNFFRDILEMFSKMMDEMDKLAKSKGQAGASGFAFNALRFGSAAVAGGSAGFGVGQELGGGASSALGGAASGALAGFAIAGPFGALAGGIAGLAGGMLGGAKAARERKQAEDELRRSLEQSLNAMKATLGVIQPLAAQIADTHQQFNQLRDQTDAAFAGKKNETEREARLKELNNLEAMRVEQLKQEAEALKQQTAAGFEVRKLRAQSALTGDTGLAQQAADQEFQIGQAKEMADFIKQFGTAATDLMAQLVELQGLESQAYEKAKADAEAAKKLAAARSLEDVDLQTAKLTATTDAQRDALEMQELVLKHQREIADLEQAKASAELVAATEAKNAAEEAALAWQQSVAKIKSAFDQLQQQFSVFGTSDKEQSQTLADLFGFSGLSREDILAQYTKYDPSHDLTDAERERNNQIAQYLPYLDKASQAATDAAAATATAVAQAHDSYNKVSYGSVTAISSSEAGGIIGRLDTANVYLATIASASKAWTGTSAAYYGDLRPTSVNQNVNFNFYINGQEVATFIESLNNPGIYQFFDRTNTRGYIRGLAGAGAPRTS
jgi:hypothetical protein